MNTDMVTKLHRNTAFTYMNWSRYYHRFQLPKDGEVYTSAKQKLEWDMQ